MFFSRTMVAHLPSSDCTLPARTSAPPPTGSTPSFSRLSFTRGEASTLGDDVDLAIIRPRELACAAKQLAVQEVVLLDYPDGGLAGVPANELERVVDDHIGDADAVVVFEPGGVTAHPDHRAATAAAEQVAARRSLRAVEWGIPHEIAAALNAEFGTTFVGVDGDDLEVDRAVQWRAIACHCSQSHDNRVLHRRLELQGRHERIRLRASADLTVALARGTGRSPLPPGV